MKQDDPSLDTSGDTPWYPSHPGATGQFRGLAMIVGDSDLAALRYRDNLRALGFRTTVRIGGTDAMRGLRQEPPVVLVLDCWAGAADPFDLLEIVDRGPGGPRTFVTEPQGAGQRLRQQLHAAGAAVVLRRDRAAEELAMALSESVAQISDPEGSVPPPLEAGLCIADRFVLRRELGRGAMATVFAARDTELAEEVALKLLHADPAVCEPGLRFRREVRLSRRLNHPNIVRLLEFGTWCGLLYLTMELVPGRTLREILRERGRLPGSLALGVVAQAAAGLSVAHAHGVVHRDIKPGNLMLRRDGRLQVVDFGLANALGDDLDATDQGLIVGSAAYLAPERLKSSSTAAFGGDVWSLGVVLYELLSGRLPFSGSSFGSLAGRILNQEPSPLRDRRPGLPLGVYLLVDQLLLKDPRRRPSDLAALSLTLRTLQRDALVLERAPR